MTMTRSAHSVIAICRDAPPAAFMETLLSEAGDCDVFVVESLARGYSRIKQLTPDLVIVVLEADHELAACQLLSMLRADAELSATAVLTWTMPNTEHVVDVVVDDRPRGFSCLCPAPLTH